MATATEIAAAEITEWLASAPGKKMDPDRAWGLQCVDLADQFAQDLTGVPWARSVGAVAGAKDLLNAANREFFDATYNDSSDADQLPPVGSLLIWGGSPLNEWGHVAVAVSVTKSGVRVLQQDGYAEPRKLVTHPDGRTQSWLSDKPAHFAELGWDNPGTGPLTGWLVLKPEKVKDTGALKRAPKAPTPSYTPTATVTPAGVMHGIDVASWQKGIDLTTVAADFVIVKVTGGTGYVNPEAKAQVSAARKSGKLVGLYHYAHETGSTGPAVAEAEHFLTHALPLADETTNFVLDWEADTVIKPGGNIWARDWLNHVNAQTGARPWLYANLNAIDAHTWSTVPGKYPLWVAWYGGSSAVWGYATDFTRPFTVKHGFTLLAWQYTQHGKLPGYGGDLDLNVFFGDGSTWKGYATGRKPAPVVPGKVTPPAPGSNKNVATFPATVEFGDTLSTIAAQFHVTVEAILKVNPQITHRDRIKTGQTILIPGKAPAKPTQCVVEAGDTLTSIASQFGVTVTHLANRNPGINLDLIHPGQVLNL